MTYIQILQIKRIITKPLNSQRETIALIFPLCIKCKMSSGERRDKKYIGMGKSFLSATFGDTENCQIEGICLVVRWVGGFRWFQMVSDASPLTDEVDLAPHAFMPHTRMLSRRFEASTHKFPKEAKEMENAVAGMKRKQQFFVHCKNSRNCGGGP